MNKGLILITLIFLSSLVCAVNQTLYFSSFDNLNFDVEYCEVHGNCTTYKQDEPITVNIAVDGIINLVPPENQYLTLSYWRTDGASFVNNYVYILLALTFAVLLSVLLFGVLSVSWKSI